MGKNWLSNARPTRFTYSEKQGGLVSLAFLKLLEKVVLALTCHDIPDSATEPINWIGLRPIFVLFRVWKICRQSVT